RHNARQSKSQGSAMTAFPVILGHVEKNSRERIRVALDEYNGRKYLDLRIFAQTIDGEKPTKAGITVRLDRIRDLRRLVDAAEREAKRLGFLFEAEAAE